MTHEEVAATVTIALCVILAACFVVGRLAKMFGQPQVVGEMVAGVCLGPSLLGALAPGVQERIFPDGAPKTILFTLSQLGVVLYMFIVGLEFDPGLLRSRARSAVSVSLAGIATPLALGALLAWFLISDEGRYFTAEVSLGQAMLFTGAAVATTAFPMLARIIKERGIARTSMGTLALASGAADDAISWCILAAVLAVFKSDATVAVLALAGGALYAGGVLTAGRRFLRRLATTSERGRGLSPSTLGVVLILVMAASWITNTIGIHSIFGGFLLGVAMPRGAFAEQLRHVLEPLVRSFLLPLFFVYSGLNTQIGLVNSVQLWAVTALVLLVSIFGKGIACWLAARASGVPQREALAIGSLMNARGLIELILLNIGLQAGIITPTLFTIMVLMAVLTTLMATPLFELFHGRHRAPETPEASPASLDELVGVSNAPLKVRS